MAANAAIITFSFMLQAHSKVPDWEKETNPAGPPTLPERLRKEPKGFGAGIYMGSPTGLAALALSYRRGRSTQQLSVGGSWGDRNLRLHLDQLWRMLPQETKEELTFPINVGLGLYVQINQVSSAIFNNDRVQDYIGVRAPLNMTVHNKGLAVDPYLELAPVLQILPKVDLGFQAGIGIRFYPF